MLYKNFQRLRHLCQRLKWRCPLQKVGTDIAVSTIIGTFQGQRKTKKSKSKNGHYTLDLSSIVNHPTSHEVETQMGRFYFFHKRYYKRLSVGKMKYFYTYKTNGCKRFLVLHYQTVSRIQMRV